VAGLAQQAEDAFERAQAALQQGDFATYGEEIDLARALIAQIVALTGSE
jgi:phage shock protein A